MYLRHHVAHRLLRAVHHPCSPQLSTSAVLGHLSRVICTDSNPNSRQPLHFGIVGSGPAGFYTASQLLKRFGEHARVDLIDRLPTPFGLVRSGVAPDHPETKNVINQFTRVGEDPRLTFLGNVSVGTDIPLQRLRQHYHAVVLAYGAESNRQLGVPGEDLRNVISAREFVWWFNGHPDAADLPVDLSKAERVTIFGMGNVALDCARILLSDPGALAGTDIAAHALGVLRRCAVRRVDLVGRRGAVQAAFTTKELREITRLEGVALRVSPADALAPSDADRAEMRVSRQKKRVHDILASAAAAAAPAEEQQQRPGGKELRMHFLRSPAALLPRRPGCRAVGAVRLEVNALQPREDGSQGAVSTGCFETLPADMVLTSIGYKSVAMEGVSFDAARGVIRHRQGRVLQEESDLPERALYAVGWAKRGPTGIIGTNLIDAEETVNSIVEDAAELARAEPARTGSAGLLPELQERGVQVVTFGDWQQIDRAEVEGGQRVGKPREKLVRVDKMLEHRTSGEALASA